MENEITFCKNRCCPKVITRANGQIVLGDSQGPEGITVWTKQNFKDFLDAAKAGKFDHIIADLCACGKKDKEQCSSTECVKPCECGLPPSECTAGFC